MLTFWGTFTESDIETYVSTLILPSYMSHMTRTPFSFKEQSTNADGRQPLQLRYFAEGRIEDWFLGPREHAIEMLRHLCPRIPLSSIRLNQEEAVWTWNSVSGHTGDQDSKSADPAMRLFFEPTVQQLPGDDLPRFDPEDAYVSVSRMELYLGPSVLKQYFGLWLRHLEGIVETDDLFLPRLDISGEGLIFQGERLGGEFLLQEDPSFHDLLRFSKLDRALEDVAGLVRRDFECGETEFSSKGIRLNLLPVES